MSEQPDKANPPDATVEHLPSSEPAVESAPSDGSSRAAHRDPQKTVISSRPVADAPPTLGPTNTNEVGKALEGAMLGHFRLEEFVGGGGMGAVFRATDTMLGRTVAVKVVAPYQNDDDTLRRFRNEAQSAARLDHPNIARVYYVGEDRGWNYIVFEFIEGVNVRELVEHKGPLSLDEAVSYTLQIAEALDHASRRDVIHRDIKPSNILIMSDGKAKLVDMGLARLHQVETHTDDLTASGVTLGTFDYISPEQARNPRNTDVRSDLYSLGCTFYYMLTGLPPFPEGTVLQKLLSHSSDAPPDPRQYRSDLSDQTVAIVRKLLSKQPADRHQHPSELIGELLLLADDLQLPTASAQGTVWIASTPQPYSWVQRHLPWAIPTAILLLAVLVSGSFMRADDDSSFPAVLRTTLDTSATTNDSPTDDGERPEQQDPAPADGDQAATAPAPPPGDAATDTPSEIATAGTATSADGGEAADNGEPSDPTTTPAVSAANSSPVASQPPADPSTVPSLNPFETRPGDAPATDDAAKSSPIQPPPVVHSIVVSDETILLDPESRRAATFAEALQMAGSNDQVDEIVLQFDGPQVVPPFDQNRPTLTDRELTIRAAADYRPLLVFEPTALAGVNSSRPGSLPLVGGTWNWRGVDFYLRLSSDLPERAGYSLFRLQGVRGVDFRDCTITVHNSDSLGWSLHENVAVFEFPKDTVDQMMDQDGMSAGDHVPSISLRNCLVRGQSTLIIAEQSLPFVLYWQNGMLITSERLLLAGGLTVEPKFELGTMDVILQNVLVVSEKGLGLTRQDASARHQLELATKCTSCLIVTGPGDPPLYVQQGGSTDLANRKLPNISGENNRYKNTSVVLEIDPTGNPVDRQVFTFNDLMDDNSKWFTEKGPKTAAAFRVPAHPVHEHTKLDYFDGSSSQPLTQILEFEPSRLPDFPELETECNDD